ncbi:acetolactate synthase-1/2/3 large subunit [Desulfosalsimonas propionicica]|uniref:Acetolactate synthase-1/2/3 large subunit n=1 Tax=Desulfosalsimonas propionicica TaxID=332175 RepID=A0A7W0HKD2_9BACT|nr:acetolactate synthase large subunit [Desulfosalsimonas propionicica]MBA2881102.1 acetolactate synthase-1/2/3 large subunit [Desulfosalsimonas propionicica]
MNGAQSLMQTLADAGVEVCFTNPGTTEIHLVAALEQVPAMRAVLCLFEGVASGAADGYARMAQKPAATLLHLGPGLANAAANLHNARRARSPMVNLVGDHPAYHQKNDPPLASDIAALAAPVSGWVDTAKSAKKLPSQGTAALRASLGPPGQAATLIIPSDCAWGESEPAVGPVQANKLAAVSAKAVETAAEMLSSGGPAALILGGSALLEPALHTAGQIAAKTGAALLARTFDARFSRGTGRPVVQRLPYFPEAAGKSLATYKKIVLVGIDAPPTPFFAYPDASVQLLPTGCEVTALAGCANDATAGLAALSEAVGAVDTKFFAPEPKRPQAPQGQLTPETIGAAIGALLPENAIVSDESVTSGGPAYALTTGAPPHDWLCLTGGAIGQGVPVATGAALACPDRKVLCLQGDGGAMYTLQALWTQARENLDITTVIFSNRQYAILRVELERLGFDHPGPRITDTMDLSRPCIDWVQIAGGMGVKAAQTDTAETFYQALSRAMAEPGPCLIEARI